MTPPDTTWLQVGQSIGLCLIGMFAAWSTWRQNKTGSTVDKIHTLSNSAMGAQLTLNVEFAQANAVQAHRIAEITKGEGDMAAAIAADVKVESQKKLLNEHLVAQARVDAQA
jgi:hypothetical protein